METQYVLPIAQLVLIANNFQNMPLCVEPETFRLSNYELDVLPGVIGRLISGMEMDTVTGFGIEKVTPRYRLGRVASFDILPVRMNDPVIVVCPLMDLSQYYRSWNLLNRCDSWRIKDLLVGYDEGIQKAIRSARMLNRDEIMFAICEMLHFRNAIMGRAR
jgi:hypothetical protein